MSTAMRNLDAETFFEVAAGLGPCELIEGEVRMMSPTGGWHGGIAGEIHGRLYMFVFQHSLGRVFAAETGFALGADRSTVRAPDIAFIRTDRLAQADTPKFIPVAPDLVVEVLSPNDVASDVAQKVQWWLDHGVPLVWVVDPANQCATVHRPDGSAQVVRRGEVLGGEVVLPGFELGMDELFAERV